MLAFLHWLRFRFHHLFHRPAPLPVVRELTIDRKTWVRGGVNGPSALLNQSGHRCCLGFLGHACGIGDMDMYNVAAPHSTIKVASAPWPALMRAQYGVKFEDAETGWTRVAMSINDNSAISEPDREDMLRDHFKALGIKLRFVERGHL